MRGHSWSDEDKAAAVALVAEKGLAEAWRQTGIPKPTIVRWCQEAGVERFHPERTRAAVDALQERSRVLRAHLRSELLERSLDLLDRMDEPHVEFKGKDGGQVEYPVAPAAAVQNYATSAAILIDKYRLEMGEATGRSETTLLDGKSDHEQRVLADIINDELERRANGNAGGAQATDPVAQSASPVTDTADH